MTGIFGPNTPRVLELLAGLPDLAPEELGTAANAWWQVDDRARAEAWVEVHRAVTEHQRYRILAAASVARRTALDVATRHRWPDWAFWAAGADAGAAVAAGDLIGRHHHTLVSPLATVMPWLRLETALVTTETGIPAVRHAADGALRKGA